MFNLTNEKCFINLNLKPLTTKDNKWFNLVTGRFNNGKKYDCVYDEEEKYKICGPSKAIEYFRKLNKIENSEVEITDEDRYIIDSVNPNDYDIFSFRDLVCVGKVTNVVDGDTVDVLIKAPINDLKKEYQKRHLKSLDDVKTCEIFDSPTGSNPSILLKLRCRFFGIDTPHGHTEKGIEATDFVNEKMLNNFFTCRFYGKGVHGRELTLFINKNGECINTKMIELGLGTPYFGGHKDE